MARRRGRRWWASPGRAVKAGGRPPGGEALTARSVAAKRMAWQAPEGLGGQRLFGWGAALVRLQVPDSWGSGELGCLVMSSPGPVSGPSMERSGAASSAQSVIRPWRARRLSSWLLAASELVSLGRSGLGETADLAVPQPVIDQSEELAGGRHLPDAAAAPFGHLAVETFDDVAAMVLGDGLDGRPPNQTGALLGDRTAMDLGVGLAMAGRHSRPRAQVASRAEAGYVADLGHEHCSEHRSDPVEGLVGPIAVVAVESLRDAAVKAGDLSAVDVDQVAQRLHAQRVAHGQLE